jgi:hypothetical protein
VLQIESIENLEGFGNKNAFGEYYHSENLIPGQFGLEANIALVDQTLNDSPSRFNWFAEKVSTNSGVYAVDTNGKLFYCSSGAWSNIRSPSSATGNGLIAFDFQLFYAYDRYLGLYTGSDFFDTYKDLGTNSSERTQLKPMEVYEDWIVIGHGRKIGIYNTTDDSISGAALTLPTSFVVRAIKSNQTGVLIGANFRTRSIIFLWDVRSVRSISEWIWLDSPIQSICRLGSRWIVTTQKQQFITDGYSVEPLPSLPDALQQSAVFSCLPAGTLVIGDKLYTANTDPGTYNRIKSGLYTQDLTSKLFSFASVDNGCKADMTMGAMFQDSSFNQYISYSTNLPSSHHSALVTNGNPDFATLVSSRFGIGPNNKIAEGVKLDISAVPTTTTLNSSASFDVAAKIYNFKRQLWGYGLTNAASSTANTIKVDGTLSGKNNAQVGDEVTILTGANAGLVRHISSISGQNTSSEVWTLDSNLSSNMESGVYLNVQPFQLIKSKSVTITSLSELESVYFDIKNRIKGRKFLVKIVISNISGIALSIPSLTFIYDDLGTV